MKASYRWIRELAGIDVSPYELADAFTRAGLEVESSVMKGGMMLAGVVVAEVRTKAPHPKRDKLTHVTVFDGTREVDVLCGAPNVPEPGARVVLATVGAKLPGGMEIAERDIAGVTSRGMLCAETELDIGTEGDGIMVLDASHTPGTPISDALELEDVIYEIGLTPNRADCLGHIGLAREAALLCYKTSGKEFAWPEHVLPAGASAAPQVDVRDASRCPRYSAVVVEPVSVGPSPFAVRYRLHNLGVRSISNVVDATNLVLMGWGHPIHAFDLDTLRGGKIVVRTARAGEKMATLDGVERTFTEDDLLICDAEGPVAVAGVMGGATSEVTAKTRRVLIEVAYFDPRSVRRTARRLGMHTEASHRFERGVDPNGVQRVVSAAVSELLAATGATGTKVSQVADVYPSPMRKEVVRLRYARIAALLGYAPDAADVRRIVAQVGCTLVAKVADHLELEPPTYRPDLTREIDLIEEVARVNGYDAIPTEMPRVRPSEEGTPWHVRFHRTLREAAAAAGLDEAINYAFVSAKELAAARVSTNAVPLAHPLSAEHAVLRTSLLPGLAGDVLRARRHQAKRVALFELARVFHPTAEALPREETKLALVLAGPRPAWIGEGDEVDFYDGKGALERLVRAAIGRSIETVLDAELAKDAPYLHPRKSARVRVNGEPVGWLGELHPDVAKALDLEQTVVYGELDVATLARVAQSSGRAQVTPLPKFPSNARDIAVVVDDALHAREVANRLREAGGPLVEDVVLFDLYRGAPVPDGKKSLAFRVLYRDREATLTDARVEQAHAKVVAMAAEAFGATVRQ